MKRCLIVLLLFGCTTMPQHTHFLPPAPAGLASVRSVRPMIVLPPPPTGGLRITSFSNNHGRATLRFTNDNADRMVWLRMKWQDSNWHWQSFDFPGFPPTSVGGYSFGITRTSGMARIFGATNAVFELVGTTNWKTMQ